MIFFISSLVLLYLSFPNVITPLGWWPCAWIFAVPLFVFLENKSLVQRLGFGLLFGVVFYGGLVVWFKDYSLTGYCFFVLALTVQPLIFFALYPAHFRNKLLAGIYLPALWVASEYVRTLVLSGFSWNLGHSQSFNIYGIQVANLIGSWGISFYLVLFNACLYKIIVKKRNRFIPIVAAVLTVVGVFSYGILTLYLDRQQSEEGELIKILTIQPNINSQEKTKMENVARFIDEQVNLTKESLGDNNVDLIVWPETAVPADFLANKTWSEKVMRLVEATQTPAIIGAVLYEGDKDYNSAVLLDPRGNVLDVYSKQYLVPFSEYIPEGIIWSLFAKGFSVQSHSFSAGKDPGLFTLPAGTKANRIGVAICSEDTISSVSRRYVKGGVDFIVVLLNDDWFRKDEALALHAQNTIMHAVENNVPIVRASNSGWSCAVDALGRVSNLGRPQWNQKTAMLHEVSGVKRKTLYNLIGDTFCCLCIVFVIMNGMLGISRGRR